MQRFVEMLVFSLQILTKALRLGGEDHNQQFKLINCNFKLKIYSQVR